MEFYGGVQDGIRNKWLNFSGDPDHDLALADLRSPSALSSLFIYSSNDWILPKQTIKYVKGFKEF